MKKIALSLALTSIFIGVSAQKTEFENAHKAFKSKDYTTVLKQAELAESKIGEDPTIEPDDVAEFYYISAKAAKESGDWVKAGEFYSKLNDIESKPFYKTKNKETRDWEYYFTKEEAEKAASAGRYSRVREDEVSKSRIKSEIQMLNKEAGESLKKGNEAFQAKNYDVAADEFLKTYYLYKAIGQDKPTFKYYAGLGYIQSKKYQIAIDIFESLLSEKFTGVETIYLATQDGKDISFANKSDMDTQVKLGLVTNPRVEKTPSLEEDLYSNTTYSYFQKEDYDKAVELGQKGLKLYPKNDNMNKLVMASYQKSGNSKKLIETLQNKVDNGTAEAVDYFNLAKSLEDLDFDANYDKAQSYYEKSIEKDPMFSDAYLNLAFLIIAPEKEFVEKMNNNLGSSKKEKKIYEENKLNRKKLYQEALPYLEKAYELNQDNVSLIKILKNTYEIVGNDDKYSEFKAKYDATINQN